jgi:ELWxxDGT repeat protein
MLELNPGPAGSDPGAGLRLTLPGFSLFSANGGAVGTELWRSDGTPSGTALLVDLAPGAASSDPHAGVVSGPLAFFVATTPALGTELWCSDGTAAGTHAIDVRAGNASSDPDRLVAQHGGVYFAATDAAGDRELWYSDGTAAGTHRVIDLAAGSSSPVVLLAVGTRRVFFTADDGLHGRELWETDGTAPGTRMLLPIRPGNGDPAVTALHLRCDGLLLFAADDGQHGSELFVHDPGAVAIPFGSGCGATLQPRVTVTDPVLGSSALLHWTSRTAGIGAIVLGFPGYAVLPGNCEVHLDLVAALAVLPVPITGGPANGALLVPASPALSGLVLALQIIAGPAPMPLGADIGNAYGLRLGL